MTKLNKTVMSPGKALLMIKLEIRIKDLVMDRIGIWRETNKIWIWTKDNKYNQHHRPQEKAIKQNAKMCTRNGSSVKNRNRDT